ncbi:MAG: glycosyltransferase family 4 protein [Thermoleophilaceae bacterium]
MPPVPVPYREPLFAGLAERGRLSPRVIYLSAAQPGWDQRRDWFPEHHGYESSILRAHQRARPGRTPVLVPRGLGRALRGVDPACVVCWEFGAATLRALAWCRRRRRPLVIFTEVTLHGEAELSAAQRRVHRRLAPGAAGFIAASSAARRRLVSLGVDPALVEVSLQSAELERFRSAPRAADGGQRPLRVLAVGRLVPDKNLGALIEGFARAGLADRAELELCGAGPLEPELRRRAERLDVPVRFQGYVAPGALPDRYAHADAVALVSSYEPFGVTMREGAAAGLPLLCSRTAGAAGDVAVEGENALLVDPDDPDEIAGALARLVHDGDLRRRLAAGSRAVTDRHPPEDDVEAFERAVLRAVGARG